MLTFLGTRLAADINLVAQVVMLIGLWVGFYFARTGEIARHGTMQTTMVMANLFFILFVMIPSFYQYIILGGSTGGIVAKLMLLHGSFGLLAQIVGIYLVLRMRTTLIPARFRIRNFKLMMQCTLGLWTAIFVLGIGIYSYRYLVAKPVTSLVMTIGQFSQAGEVLAAQAGKLRAALTRGDGPSARRIAERLVNLIEGKTGSRYGDLDKDGSVEDPGDGIGLLNYVRMVTSADVNPETATLAQEVASWLTSIREHAVSVAGAANPGAVSAAAAPVLAERVARKGIAPLVARAPLIVIVVMDEYEFKPPTVRVAKGATVAWINQEAEAHTVTADDGRFDSGDLDRGGIFTLRVREAGTIPYHCVYHGGRGGVDMAGALLVE